MAPILRKRATVALLGVGNKPRNFTDHDTRLLQFLGELTWDIAEEKFSSAFHVTSDAVHLTDFATGKFIEVNEGFVRQSGYSRAEAIGRTELQILDVNMPDIGGCDVFGQVRNHGKSYPVLFVIGNPDETLRKFVVSHPGSAMLAKPFTQAELRSAIRRICDTGNHASERPKDQPAGEIIRQSSPLNRKLSWSRCPKPILDWEYSLSALWASPELPAFWSTNRTTAQLPPGGSL